MDRNEKIKVAITAGVVAAILLILVLFLALSGNKENAEEKLNENISEYASLEASEGQNASTDTVSANESASGSSLEADSESSSIDSSTEANTSNNSKVSADISGNSFYPTKSAVLKDAYKGLAIDVDAQLFEMYTYWNNGNVDAVRDLAHLERFEAMSYKLTGTTNFYYYGETNADGVPEGMGLAVYAGDQYYYGQWKNGKRSGNGTWINFFPDYSNYVVTEHMYAGSWEDDLPSGEGQEHFDYDLEKINVEDIYIQNAIGNFDKGFFDGDMYVLTIRPDGNVEEWYGTCEDGTWLQVVNSHLDEKGRIPVLKKSGDDTEFIYMTEKGTKDQRVKGIVESGRIAK